MERMAVYLIIGAITLACIILFAFFLGNVFLSSSNVAICQASSSLRHQYESAFCIQTIGGEFCGSDIARFFSPTAARTGFWSTPLFGCSSNFIPLGGTNVNEFAETLTKEVADCWTKFGEGRLDVLWLAGENPRECSVVSGILTNQRLNAKIFTDTLVSTNYTRKFSCEGLDAECCPGFYECSQTEPSLCVKLEENPWLCETKGKYYYRCETGFQAKETVGYYECLEKLGDFACPDFYEYDNGLQKCKDSYQTDICPAPYSCESTASCEAGTCVIDPTPPDIFQYYEPYTTGGCPDGYEYNGVLEKCTETLQTDTCPAPYTCTAPGTCQDGTCVADYTTPTVVPGSNPTCKYCENTDGLVLLPRTCTVEESSTCERMITYADYVKPGHKTVYSFNSPDGETLVDANDSEVNVTGQVNAYVYFIDSFTGTRKDAEVGILPEYCSSQTFVDSCSECPSCLRAVEVGGAIGLGLAPGAITTGVTLIYDAYQFFILGSPTTMTGIPSCAACVASTLSRHTAELMACTDKVIICFKQQEV